MRSRLPEELWAAAVELVQRDGIDATARALDVDKPSLRKWSERLQPGRHTRRQIPGGGRREQPLISRGEVGRPPISGRQPRKQRANAMPAFVELLASGSGRTTSCLVEVESPQGGKLRLELKGIGTSELVELIRAFATA